MYRYGCIEAGFNEDTKGILEVWSKAEFEPVLARRIADEASQKRIALERDMEAKLEQGMPYTFGEVEDVVQTRPSDMQNLLAIAIRALDGEGTVRFRALSNKVYELTSHEASYLSLGALGWVEGLQAEVWQAKDELEVAAAKPTSLETLNEVRAICLPANTELPEED